MAMALGIAALKTLYIIEILTERTDETHSLNATDIQQILQSEYGVTVNRQTLYSEIGKLTDFGMDIVQQTDTRRRGYYLASRRFELPELKLLVDMIQSSRFITEKKSRELIAKLETMCSHYEARQLSGQVIISHRPKTENETIYYIVDKTPTAIYTNCEITYQYADWTPQKTISYRHDGAFYIVSPLQLVWDDENYYLVGYDEKAGKVKHYRIDRMRNMAVLDRPRSAAALSEQVDPSSFGKKVFGMYGGEEVQIRLDCASRLAGIVLDRFGTDILLVPKDEAHFEVTVTVAVSPQFFGWVTAIGDGMRIAGPENVRIRYMEYLRNILERYS